jgi:hypothetical protein
MNYILYKNGHPIKTVKGKNMKNAIFTILAAMFVLSTTSKVMASDETIDLVKCRPATLRPDLGMSLTLSAGGVAGETVIRIERFFLGQFSEKSYVVRQSPIEPQQDSQSMLFLGEDISFQADFSRASIDGGTPALLKLRQGTNDLSIEELSCQVIQQIPEINLAY